MKRRGLHRILVFATGPLNERLAGPEIRALEFAKALSVEYDVTLVAQRADESERDGLRVIPASRHRILAEAARHDAILSPGLPPYLLALKPLLGISAIADQYDPYELELVSLVDETHDRELGTQAMWQALQLRHADLVLCAGAYQREELIAAAARLKGPGLPPLAIDPVVVPFGIPDPPPASARRPLREHFPQIDEDDSLVIWWGTVWKWLDATTAIRAFARIAASRPDVKLVITAGRPPNKNNERFDATGDAIELARELGVLDRSVLFLDEWIPYEDRHDYLREATLGMTLHRSSKEAKLAARARYMDYLSAELPCVLGRGDETAADFEAAGFATLLDRPDPELLASTLLALLDDPQRLAASRSAGHRLAAERRWSAVGQTLRTAVGSMPQPTPVAPRTMLELLAGTGTYYRRRVADVLGATAG
jgi:glycosyltransferase involved in cell wall biosynthesis